LFNSVLPKVNIYHISVFGVGKQGIQDLKMIEEAKYLRVGCCLS